MDASADLSVKKSAEPNPARPGASITYEVLVKNAGPSDALNIGESGMFQ